MSLRIKLTLAFLIVGLACAGLVGGAAYWLLMRDFRGAVEDEAFGNFQQDVAAYVGAYGSWAAAVGAEPFTHFVRRRHDGPANRLALPRAGLPPFHFLLLDPEGRVLLEVPGYTREQAVGTDVLRQARPVVIGDRVVAQAVAVGEPQLTEDDRMYLAAMRKALAGGMALAGVLALAGGAILARRISRPLGELTRAIRSMHAGGELRQQVKVRSGDEIGALGSAFNAMSAELGRIHQELRQTNVTVGAQAAELRELSLRDPLTHLYNRRHFDEQARTLYELARRRRRPLSMVVSDLDHFKEINDRFSHATGDEVLRRVARLLARHTRASDVCARYGGEEFVLACSDSTAAQTARRCDELRALIEAHPWDEVHPALKVTISIGVCDELVLGDVEKMLAEADRRLYRAKALGRNRVVAVPAQPGEGHAGATTDPAREAPVAQPRALG